MVTIEVTQTGTVLYCGLLLALALARFNRNRYRL